MPRICPAALEEARRLVGRPDPRTPVSVTMNAWATLKAERGQSVDFRILGDAHHITDETLLARSAPAAEPIPLTAEIDATRERVKPRIADRARQIFRGPTGGDAA